jgi:phosphotransferase system IIB component
MNYKPIDRDVERLRVTVEETKLIDKTKEEQELTKLDALRINHP